MNISFSTSIQRHPCEVFAWIDDPDKAMRWQKGVKGGTITRETPERVGTTFTETLEEDGQTLEMIGTITGYQAGRSIAFHLESRLHAVDVTYTVAPEAGGSLVRIDTSIRWKFPFNIMMVFIGAKARAGIIAQTRSELAELKRLCESS
jgi:hypothetical protein